MIQTYQDTVDNLIDFVGGGPGNQVLRNIRQAIAEAYREMTNAHNWPYLYRHGRIFTNVPFSGLEVATTPAGGGPVVYTIPNPLLDPPPVGTVVNPDGSISVVSQATLQYQQSSGTYSRQVTITGGVWPTWAAAGYLRVANENSGYDLVTYRVSQLVSPTILTLDDEVNPGGDIPAGAEFILYQDTYLLPDDFRSADKSLYELNIGGMRFVAPREWLFSNRYVLSEGTPVFYTITGDPQYPGRLVMRLAPWPVEQRSIDFIYQRRPRPLVIQQAGGGTVSVASGSMMVTCSAPAFTPAMVGSIIRISSNAQTPTSAIGSVSGYNPPSVEATITGWVSSTVVNIDTPPAGNLTAVGWYVSDPIDYEPGAMTNAFLRCCEKCIAKLVRLKTMDAAQADYLFALAQAKAASSPSFAGRRAGPPPSYRLRLRDLGPVGADEP